MTLTNQVLKGQPSSSHIRLQGLSEIEVAAQRSKSLGNSMPVQVSRSYFQIVRENVFNSINTILFILGIALVLLGRVSDALVAVGVVLVNVLVSVMQEVHANDYIAIGVLAILWGLLLLLAWRMRLLERFLGVE